MLKPKSFDRALYEAWWSGYHTAMRDVSEPAPFTPHPGFEEWRRSLSGLDDVRE